MTGDKEESGGSSGEKAKATLQIVFEDPLEALSEAPSEAPSQVELASVRISKFPPFLQADPELWFAQVENIFAYYKIKKDESRFQLVAGGADAIILPHVADIIKAPPTKDRYSAFKERVLAAFAESEEVRLRRLLKGSVLGSQRPSHFLQALRNQAQGKCGDAMLRSLFLEQLPVQYRGILAVHPQQELQQLALLADKLMELPRFEQVDSVQPEPPQPAPISALERRVDELTQTVRELCAMNTRMHGNQSSSRDYSQQRGRGSGIEEKEKLCWYHARFGKDARRCDQPCSWKGRRPQPGN